MQEGKKKPEIVNVISSRRTPKPDAVQEVMNAKKKEERAAPSKKPKKGKTTHQGPSPPCRAVRTKNPSKSGKEK